MLIRLSDVAASRIPDCLGLCADDLPRLSSYTNEAQQRLLLAGGDQGWVGTYHKVVFTVNRSDPYITLPAAYERISAIAAGRPMPIRNEWYEFLEEGTGPLPNPNCPSTGCLDICGSGQAFDRNSVPTAVDLTPTNQYLRVYLTDVRDVGQKILVSGALDQNGVGIYSQDVNEPVNGFLMVLTSPFTTSESIVTSFNAIGKSVTYGDVLLKQVDATTGEEVLLSRYTPNETNPSYRRYYLRSLPRGCCNGQTTNSVLVTAMCKRAYAPVANLTDYLIIGNIPALKAECESIRYSEIDNVPSQAMAKAKHLEAISLLNKELRSFVGEGFSVNLAPFGSAALEREHIGSLT